MSQLANNFAELSNSLRYDHWYFKTSNNSTIQNVNSFLDNGVFGHTFHVSRDLEQTKKFLCEVNVWSNKNPNHIPITLFLNAKEDNLGSEDLITLNKILLDTLGNKLFSCETFCGNWPLVNAMLNKIVVVLTGNSQVRSRYYWEKSIMNPCVAANIHGKILVVFNKMSDSQIPEVWYYTGEYLADGCIRWDCTGRVGTGSTPSVLLTNHGSGLLVYEIEQELFYSVIKIQDNNDVTWQPGTRYDKGITPSISIRDGNGNTFIEVHRSEKDNAKMWTHVGKIIDTNEGKVVMEQSKCISQQIIGYFPSIRYYPNRDIEVLYESENLDKLELHGSKITNTLIGWNTKGIKLTDKKSFNEDAVVKDGQFVRIKIVDGVLQYETDRKSGLVRLTQHCFVDYLPTIDLNFKQEVQKPGKLMFASLNAKCDPSEIGKLTARNMMVRFWSYNEIKPAKKFPNFAATDDPLSMEYQNHYETFWSDKQRNPEEELAKVKKECLQSLTNLKGEFAENLVKILSEYETAVKNETSRLIKECNLDPNLRSDMMQHEHQRLEKLTQDFMELNGVIECLDLPSISAGKFKKRWHLVQEILESEWNFSKKLETLLTELYHPLKLYSTSTMATKEELNIMFDCVPELLKASNTTLAGLEEAVKDYSMHEMIADVFLQMLPYFKCFSLFVNNVPEALKTYNNCMNREAFSKFVNKKIDYTIPGLLDSPVRRMGLVRALLKNLLDELDPNHKDYTKLSQAHQKFTQLNEETNKLKEVSENRQKVLAISEKVEKELVQPDRLFVREGHLMTKNGNGVIDISTYVFLFTDGMTGITQLMMEALVITHQKRLNSFTFRELLLFSECEFRKLNTSEYCGFCLTKGEKSIEFYAHTEGDCKGWNEDLSKLFHQNKTNRISRAPSVVWRH